MVSENLRKAQKRWVQLSWIIVQEGGGPCNFGNFYNMVVQETLLFGRETWVMLPIIGRTIHWFHHRMYRRLVGMRPRQNTMEKCIYPPLEADMMAVGLKEV